MDDKTLELIPNWYEKPSMTLQERCKKQEVAQDMVSAILRMFGDAQHDVWTGISLVVNRQLHHRIRDIVCAEINERKHNNWMHYW